MQPHSTNRHLRYPAICGHCGKTFDCSSDHLKKAKYAVYCSHACARKTRIPFDIRFWSKVTKTDTCWLWIGQTQVGGYGQFKLARHNQSAHRISWELAYGPIPDGLWVLHRCDTPACVRPAHLFLGTGLDNVADKVAKVRQAKGDTFNATMAPHRPRGDRNGSRLHPESRPRGERNTAARLTEQQVLSIRRRFALGERNQATLAKEFGVSKHTIHMIVRNKAWCHLI